MSISVTHFIDYDRISDTLMFFSDSIMLEFVVNLSSKDKNGNRVFFHTEIDYDSNKYYGVDKGHSIKRRMTFYYVINDKRAFDRSFIIRPEDAMMLTMIIESQILPWYFDPKRNIFSIIEGQLKIIGKFQDITFAKNEYSYLKFSPCVYRFEDNTYKEGIRMYLSSDTYVDMEIDKFLGLYYFLSKVDMYSVACSMATYAKVEPYNVNAISMNGLGSSNRRLLDNPNMFSPEDNSSSEKQKAMNNFFSKTTKKK